MGGDYFKSYKLFKFVQLTLLVIFAVVFFLFIFLDDDLRYNIFSNKSILTICVFLWAFMLYCVFCIFMDFRQLEGHIIHDQLLKKTVYVDTLTGIPNRFSCDQIFEKYDENIDISRMGCALIRISNLESINEDYGRTYGNIALKEFSTIVERVGAHYGFVGRNNGNEFLTVIDVCDGDVMDRFIADLDKGVNGYNKTAKDCKIEIKVASVLNEALGITDFRTLVAKLYGRAKG